MSRVERDVADVRRDLNPLPGWPAPEEGAPEPGS